MATLKKAILEFKKDGSVEEFKQLVEEKKKKYNASAFSDTGLYDEDGVELTAEEIALKGSLDDPELKGILLDKLTSLYKGLKAYKAKYADDPTVDVETEIAKRIVNSSIIATVIAIAEGDEVTDDDI